MGSQPQRHPRRSGDRISRGDRYKPKSLAAEGNEGQAAGATPSAAEVRDETQDTQIDGMVVDLGSSARGGDRADFRIGESDLGRVKEARVNAPRAESDYSPRVKKTAPGECSPKPQKSRSLKIKGEYSPCQIASAEVVDMAAYKAAVTIHPPAVFEDEKWKRSRVKKGFLIARVKGYDPVESEYGVHYLKVLSRHPKKTSGDCSLHEHAGFFNWEALEAAGRLVKERKRYERVSGDRANAS